MTEQVPTPEVAPKTSLELMLQSAESMRDLAEEIAPGMSQATWIDTKDRRGRFFWQSHESEGVVDAVLKLYPPKGSGSSAVTSEITLDYTIESGIITNPNLYVQHGHEHGPLSEENEKTIQKMSENLREFLEEDDEEEWD